MANACGLVGCYLINAQYMAAIHVDDYKYQRSVKAVQIKSAIK